MRPIQKAKGELERAHLDAIQHSFIPSRDRSRWLDEVTIQKRQPVMDKEFEAEQVLELVSISAGVAFVEDARRNNATSKLSRYETSLERSGVHHRVHIAAPPALRG